MISMQIILNLMANAKKTCKENNERSQNIEKFLNSRFKQPENSINLFRLQKMILEKEMRQKIFAKLTGTEWKKQQVILIKFEN